MTNINDIIKLCQEGEGKVFVLDSNGNVSLVMLSIDEYQRIIRKPKKTEVDPELVNKQILRAQLEDDTARGFPSAAEGNPLVRPPRVDQQPIPVPKVDLREEVIDPSFDFED